MSVGQLDIKRRFASTPDKGYVMDIERVGLARVSYVRRRPHTWIQVVVAFVLAALFGLPSLGISNESQAQDASPWDGQAIATQQAVTTDIVVGRLYERPVAWLTQANVTAGTTPTTFSPTTAVTRAQMATFLYRLAGSPVVGGATPFVDVSATGTFYSTPVLWLVQSGITAGTSPMTFSLTIR